MLRPVQRAGEVCDGTLHPIAGSGEHLDDDSISTFTSQGLVRDHNGVGVDVESNGTPI